VSDTRIRADIQIVVGVFSCVSKTRKTHATEPFSVSRAGEDMCE
jgi:hypothetical protein